jgi:hypothetical protein
MRLILSFLFILISFPLLAQSPDGVEMADLLRSNGKIYVVVAVLATIFIGLVIYLVIIDKKLSRLEKQIGKGQD